MSNRPGRPADEQYQLIIECRSSGMSDHQWCMEHDIKPGTFYNWVKRLRRRGGYDIPPAAGKNTFSPAPKQDIVKMEILPESYETVIHPETGPSDPGTEAYLSDAPIRIRSGSVRIDLSNDVDPRLLAQILCTLGGV